MGKLILNGKEYIRSIPSPFPPIIYSKEEREVGVWTDGKPLYQKTVHINSLPSTTYSQVQYTHGILNIDMIVDYNGVVRWASGSVAKMIRVAIFSSSAQDNFANNIAVEVDKTNILIAVGSNRSSMNADVTILYTKTTDTPGSGKWTTQGTLSHHYSTNEQVIGTWIDGKPIYEKTIVKNNYRLEVGANQISLGVTNIEIIDSNVQITNSGHTSIRKLNHRESSGTDNLYYLIYYVTGYINIYAEATWGSPNIHITIQYTKSTD